MGSVWRITFPSGWEMLYIYAHEGTAKVSVGAQVMRVVRQFSYIFGSVPLFGRSCTPTRITVGWSAQT